MKVGDGMEQYILPLLAGLCGVFVLLAVIYLLISAKTGSDGPREQKSERKEIPKPAEIRPETVQNKGIPKKESPEPSPVISAGKTAGSPEPLPEISAVEKLRSTDPDFSADDMKAYVSACFLRLNAVVRAEELLPLRGFLSEALYLRRRSSLLLTFSDPEADIPEYHVDSVTIGRSGEKNGREYLAVYIDVRTEENAAVQCFRALYSRIAGTKTQPGIRLSEFRCPCCGNPLETDAEGICSTCKMSVADGSRSWILEALERK